MSQQDLTLAGVGGQGSILAGVILGAAAVTYDGKFAVQTQAYSAELRGGFAAAWVIVSDQPIQFPRVTRPDILVAQAQDSVDRFAATLKDSSIMICDSDLIKSFPGKFKNGYGIPATSLARNKIKNMIVTNMIMLGALCSVTGVVSKKAIESAIKDAVPNSKEEINLEAFELGYENVSRFEL
jgi:2-oxoglutarate ferredoxin oxidoreductase subunit gamma